jgi:hypothetical protein
MVLAMAEDPRFGEILSVAEGLDAENIKKAIRKSRVVFNRGGADEQVPDPGARKHFEAALQLHTNNMLAGILKACSNCYAVVGGLQQGRRR